MRVARAHTLKIIQRNNQIVHWNILLYQSDRLNCLNNSISIKIQHNMKKKKNNFSSSVSWAICVRFAFGVVHFCHPNRFEWEGASEKMNTEFPRGNERQHCCNLTQIQVNWQLPQCNLCKMHLHILYSNAHIAHV